MNIKLRCHTVDKVRFIWFVSNALPEIEETAILAGKDTHWSPYCEKVVWL
jgi:hypothetical protein